MPLPSQINEVLNVFQSFFTVPTWSKMQVLLIGTLLARGRRTVAAALRQTGHDEDSHFSHYHHVLNRTRWSLLAASRCLLGLVVSTFARLDGPVTLVIDETLERRWGRRIRLRGHYRDPLASSREQSVSSSGLRWLVAPLAMDARLFAPPEARRPGQPGRPAVVGERRRKLIERLHDPATVWQTVRVRWYDQRPRDLQALSGTALWYRFGLPPLPVRWLLVRDPHQRSEPRAYFSTRLDDTPEAMLDTAIARWPIEVTFEECRAHLGIQTQRHWSDKAIGCSTPLLLGLYSLVVLFAHALHPNGRIPVRTTAWYQKSHATFADVLATVRRAALWGGFDFPTAEDPQLLVIPKALMRRLEYSVCYAH